MSDGNNFLDGLLDAAEKVVGGAEKVFARRGGGAWLAEEVLDGETGVATWEVHQDGRSSPRLTTVDRSLAERVATLLNTEG